MTMLEHALAYAAQHLHVFPLKPKSKIPFKNSHGFQEATCDEAQIRQWWKRHPSANIGLATGVISGVVVIDFDPKNGGDAEKFLAEHEELRGLVFGRAKTCSGGDHLFFRNPPGEHFASCTDLFPGVDVRGEGGYVVMSPSWVVDKEKGIDGGYRWIE